MTKIQDIKALIAQGNTESALRQLQDLTKNAPLENEVAVLSARFQKIQKEILLGTADEAAGRTEINQINFAALALLDLLSANRLAPDFSPGTNWGNRVWLALALALVLAAVFFFRKKRAPETAQIFEFQYVQQGMPTSIVSKIDSLQKAGEMVNYIGLEPQGKSWIILFGRNKFIHNSNLPIGLVNKLREFKDVKDAELRGAYLAEGSSYLAWLDLNDYWYHFSEYTLPRKMLMDSLNLYYHQNRKIRDIALAPNGSWAVLWGQNGYTCNWQADTVFGNRLKDFVVRRNAPVKQFFFSKDSDHEWLFLHGQNGFEAGDIDPNLRNKLLELQRGGREILKVFMRASHEWIVFFK